MILQAGLPLQWRLSCKVIKMFNPSQEDVRRFFCVAYRKMLAREVLSPLEAIAVDWIQQHPEYHDDLADVERALANDYSVETGKTNPFLHLAMHLSISEQISIDQPRGVKLASQQLSVRYGDLHLAHHEMMEALGQMIWNAQRSGTPPDGAAYIEDLQRRVLS